MDRNTEVYGQLDTIETPRSTWERSHTHKTTFNAGDLVPLYINTDIIPGTTIKNKTSFVIRLQTPIHPTMDNLYFDYYWFRAPKFWYWEHFKEQMGQNSTAPWTQTIQYNTPCIDVQTAYGPNDLASYFGIRQGITDIKYDRLAINFYIDIWNNWFRSQVVQAPILFDKTDSDLTSDGTINTGYGLLKACRTHDYFSSALIEPAQGSSSLPLGLTAPVVGTGTLGITDGTDNGGAYRSAMTNLSGSAAILLDKGSYGTAVGTVATQDRTWGSTLTTIGVSTDGTKSGLIADLSQATAATVNALRLAVATQRIMERMALYGNVYRDLLHQWGVYSNSQDTLIPEYCGGSRVPINIDQLVQTSETTNNSELGTTGAYSLTANVDIDFTKSFTTHDMLICVGVVRVAQHTYCQGIPRQFKRMQRYDHYWPEFCHIGNTPIYNYEIFAQGDTVVDSDGNIVDNQVFGYKEAWQEYMYHPNRVSGEFSSDYAQSLDSWTYQDDYATLPVLGSTWMEEDKSLVDRTIAVTSSEANQFFGDFLFEQTVSAPIPLHRTPGLMDHF